MTSTHPRQRGVLAGERTTGTGFTLIELLVIMLMLGVMLTLGGYAFKSYQAASGQKSSVQEVVSILRNAQQRALTEAVSFCVKFDSTTQTVTTYRSNCTSGTVVNTRVLGFGSTIVNPSFTQPDLSVSSLAVFTPRGTASDGQVQIGRNGNAKRYTISVEGLTSRVSQS